MPDEARELVAQAAPRLWSPEGRETLVYLQSRGLSEPTIRRHRLGWARKVVLPTSDGLRFWHVGGIVIPWFDGERLSRVKVRQPDNPELRYVQVFADRPTVYPGIEAIRPGLPLIAAEGELDALLLGQQLEDLAGVITPGSASDRPDRSARAAMGRCDQWFAAHDADDAGDRAAAAWSDRATRVRPPAGKDWTDARMHGFDLRRWWIAEQLSDART